MSRTKLILCLALALGIVLAVVFLIQVRQLRNQVRSAVRIIPGDAKSSEDATRRELEQGAPRARADLLVKFRSGASAEPVKQIIERFNDQMLDEIEAVPGLMAIDDRDNADAQAAAAQYRALPEVEYAEPNYEINIQPNSKTIVTEPSDVDSLWAATIGRPQAWTRTKGSGAIVVAILDTGVDYDHPELANNIWKRPAEISPYHDRDLGTRDDVHGYNALDNNDDPFDDNGHGTAEAGIIGSECGKDNGFHSCAGVNSTASIMALKFLNAGGYGTVADAIEAINYAIDRKHAGVNIRVINAGWGLGQYSRALEDVIRKAGEAGILFVAASGDTHQNNDTQPYYPASYQLENVLSVAAVNSNDTFSSGSNYGAKTVQLAAPGQSHLTTAPNNGHQVSSDTSVAAAMVSGVAVLALSVKPELTVGQLRSLLLSSVDKKPGLMGKVSTGGRINAAKAVK
ncbi:MAG TPA: S8 family peptidase [Pyrinomonadaceae bacterium]|nr:S8 family peptidase [Pyrinomonadaceae bacterium]